VVRILIIISVVSGLLILSCAQHPLDPALNRWVLTAELPNPYLVPGDIFSRGDGTVYIVGRSLRVGFPPAIYKYENGRMIEDYEPPYVYSGFYGVSFHGDVGWAVGYKYENDHTTVFPYMVYYDGVEWAEKTIPADRFDTLYRTFAINGTDCWVLAGDSESGFNRYYCLFKYDDGVCVSYPHLTDILTASYCQSEGTFYCLRDGSGDVQGNRWELYITNDNGTTWTVEVITAKSGLHEVNDLADSELYAVPGALFFTGEVESNGFPYKGAVIKRTGRPGEGVYEVVFLSPVGPYFFELEDIAFKDALNGIIVGMETSVVYEDPNWVLEDVSGCTVFPDFTHIATGGNRYWGLVDDSGKRYLLSHP